MTTVLAVYEGGVLRPTQPLPFGEGETDEVTVAKSKPLPSPDEWARRIHDAKNIQEWVALANACPTTEPGFDIVKGIDESRQSTGFRMPDSEPNGGEPA